MPILLDNLAILHVFALVAATAWVHAGRYLDWMLPWEPALIALVALGMFCFPQARRGEPLPEARRRVWASFWRDGFSWVALALIALLTIPFVNRGLCPGCDAAAIAAGADPSPPVGLLPSCVSARSHLEVYLWFLPAFVSALAARHALRRRGRRTLVELLVWSAAGLAVLGFVQLATGAQGPYWAHWTHRPLAGYFFSAWGYPNHAGSFFTLFTALSLAVWRRRAEEAAHRRAETGLDAGWRGFMCAHYPLVAVALAYSGALATLSRSAIVFSTLIVAVASVHVFAGAFQRGDLRAKLRMSVGLCTALVGLGFALACFTPASVRREVGSLSVGMMFQRVDGKHYVPAALALWRERPVFGVGGWGYQHLCYPYLPRRDQLEIKDGWGVGRANVHDDMVQFMCEHGLAGLALLIAAVALLLRPAESAWRRLYNAARFALPGRAPAKPYAIYCFPAPALFILLGAVAVYIQSLGDCPLRCPPNLCSFLLALACVDGYLPRNS